MYFLLIAIGPALYLLRRFENWDLKRPEPPGQVRNACIFGALTCIPAGIIEYLEDANVPDLMHMQGNFGRAFLSAGLTEESLKLLVVLLYLWPKKSFDEVMDGILYTAAASLGFALLENVLYVANGGIGVGIVRALTAVPMHAGASGIMGYFVGRARFSRGGQALWILAGLATAVFIHGLYDWSIMSEGAYGYGPPNGLVVLSMMVGTVVTAAFTVRLLVQHALRIDDALLGAHARPLPSTFVPAPAVAAYPYGAQGYPQPQAPFGAPQQHPGGPYAPQPPYAQGYPQPQYGPPAPGAGYAPPAGPPASSGAAQPGPAGYPPGYYRGPNGSG